MPYRRRSTVVPFQPRRRPIAYRPASKVEVILYYIFGAVAIVTVSVLGTVAWHKRADLAAAMPRGLISAQPFDTSWSYPNCRAARSAGAAPIYAGQPGFGAHLDRDGDGIACEPYRGN